MDMTISSLSTTIMMFYLLMATSYSRPIVGKQFKEYLQDNRIVKHLVTFLTLAVLLTITSPELSNVEIMTYAVMAYIIFILTTKVDIHWNVMIVLLLVMYYFIERDYKLKILENEYDTTFNDEMRKQYILNAKYRMYVYATVMIGVTFIGMYLYNSKKVGQYGGGYDPLTFFFY